MERKKRICLVTNWYPTRENPYNGLFFKEQAFAMSEYYDFTVFRYVEKKKKVPWNKYSVSNYNTEKNTVEYAVEVYVPIWIYLADMITDFMTKHIKTENLIEGVGRYTSVKKLKYTKKILQKIFSQNVIKNFDVLYCVDAQNEASTLKQISEITGKPYIVGEHAPFPWPGNVIKSNQKDAIENADLFLAISYDKVRQLLLQNVKLPEMVYIGNLIDEDGLTITEKNPGHIKTFIIVAANSFYKNYDLFIAVMNRLTEITDEKFKVMIVGYAANKGYSKNPEILEKKVYNSKFADMVEMIKEVSHDKIGKVFNRADAFVMTSIQEGQPVSAMEAACCGLPIFSTRCGGVEDYVDEKIGRIYNVTDYEGMAQGLKDFLEGKITFDSQYIRSQIVKQFGKKAFVANFTTAFDGVIERWEQR